MRQICVVRRSRLPDRRSIAHSGRGTVNCGYLRVRPTMDGPAAARASCRLPSIQINRPPHHRVNAGINASRGRCFGSLSVSYASRAFWADVQPYSGYTNGYTLVNGTAGVRFRTPRGDGSLALKVVNIGDSEIRQHIFGDLLRRRATLELRFNF